MREIGVRTAGELLGALADGARRIIVRNEISRLACLRLPPGVHLEGGSLVFGARGIVLSTDNELSGIVIDCPEHEVAIGNDTGVEDLGSLVLRDVRTTGQVLVLVEGAVRNGAVVVDGLTVAAADLRGRLDRPHGFGVDAMQGALTIWNRQPDPDVVIEATVDRVSVGSPERPIRGSGVFVGGLGDDEGRSAGGHLEVTVLGTGAVHVDGGIRPGTTDLISGAVFVQTGAVVDEVRTAGPVMTAGANDMALDNWGEVRRWICTAPVTTAGPSGIGVVNFGYLRQLDVRAPIETFGTGARGFNLYGGSLESAAFDSICTHGDGAVGVQVSVPMPTLVVRGDVVTTGGEGTSLVQGQPVTLKAVALSVKPGGRIDEVIVGGHLRTTGSGVVSMELLGPVGSLRTAKGIVAQGTASDAVHVAPGLAGVLAGVELQADHGSTVVEVRG